MAENTIDLQEIQRLRREVVKLRGRNWFLGFELIESLEPDSVAANLARTVRVDGSIQCTYDQIQMIDLTGSTEACFALMSRIGIGVEDWSYYRVESDFEGRICPDGPYSFSFNQPGVVIRGEGWTAPAAILDAILSSREWPLIRDNPIEKDDPQDCRFQLHFNPRECEDVTKSFLVPMLSVTTQRAEWRPPFRHFKRILNVRRLTECHIGKLMMVPIVKPISMQSKMPKEASALN